MNITRRVRALATTALVWGGLYAAAGAVFNLLQTYWGSSALELGVVLDQTRWVAFRWAAIGVVSGGVFGVLLSRLERRDNFADLKLRRVALWGIAGGMALPLLNSALILTGVAPESVEIGTLVAHTVFGGMLGSACATTLLHIARGGSRDPARQEVLTSGAGAAYLPSGEDPVKTPWKEKGVRASIRKA